MILPDEKGVRKEVTKLLDYQKGRKGILKCEEDRVLRED